MIIPYVYDAGALIGLDRGKRHVWARHRLALEDSRRILIPAAALAQVWRDGRRQYELGRLLPACEIVQIDGLTAKDAGALCGKAGTSDVVGAMVMIVALKAAPAIVWTSDLVDLDHLRRTSDSATIMVRKV